VKDDCRPWDKAPFAADASVRDAKGSDYRIEWDFEAHKVRLYEGARDRSAEVAFQKDEVRLGERLIGVGLADFRQVCCLDQHALDTVSKSPSLELALQEAVAQIGGDIAASEVVQRLNDFLKERVGVNVASLNPNPTGRLRLLTQDRDALTDALANDSRVREQITALAQRLELNRSEHKETLDRIAQIRQGLLRAERDDVAGKVEQARLFRERASQRVELPGLPSTDALVEIKAALVHLDEVNILVSAAESRAAQVEEGVEASETRERELDTLLENLASYAKIDVSGRDAVQTAMGQIRALAQQAPSDNAALTADPLLARYRAERSELYALQAGKPPRSLRRVTWIALVALTVGLAALARAALRRFRRTGLSQAELVGRLAPFGAKSLSEMDDRVADEDRRLAAAQAQSDLATEAERRTKDLSRELALALEAVKAVSADTVEATATGYLMACARHDEYVAAALEREQIKNELQVLRKPQNDRRAHESDRESLLRKLRALYESAGIVADDLGAARDALAALETEAAQAGKANEQADAAAHSLKGLLGDSAFADLEDELAKTESELFNHIAVHGAIAAAGGDVSALKVELAQLQNEAADTHDRLTEDQTKLAGLESDVADTADLEERRADLDARIARLNQAKEAVRIARDVLREASDELNKKFQPHLRDALRKNLPRITGGRYSEVEVDSELRVQVIAPVGGQVRADQLSRGTQDQIFLVQRLEIARILAPTKGAAPLLLDDPFARYDAKRLRFGLQLLGEAAAERQVIVFSEDSNLPALAKELCGDCHVVELTGP
jgi:DNA repair exonuclease SbcCD ATPase subunit